MGVEALVAVVAANSASIAAETLKQWWRDRNAGPVDTNEQVKVLLSEFQDKRGRYLQSSPDPGDAVELRRSELLKRITLCQNRILFEVSDPDLINRTVPFAIEQTTSLYTVSNEAEFAIIEMGIGQLDSILARNKQMIKSRSTHRSLAVWFAAAVVIGLVILISVCSSYSLTTETEIPIIKIPLPIIIWSCIGSLGAMLYRFNISADAELADPLRWSFTRPLTGVLMGIIAYMVFKVGILVLQPGSPGTTTSGNPAGTSSQELLWLAAFLAGFSDRFADSVLRSLTGRLGGDRQADLVTAERTVQSSTLSAIAERLGLGGRRPPPPGPQAPAPAPAAPAHQAPAPAAHPQPPPQNAPVGADPVVGEPHGNQHRG
jgi:hypothetical protein